MKGKKKYLALVLAAVMLLSSVSYAPAVSSAAAGGLKITKRYTISKTSGTYSSDVKVVLKAKKGYKIYYTTTGSLKKNNLIKSGKKKIFNIKKTTTLSIYAVKKSEKVTAEKLKKVYKNNKSRYFKQYKYIIKNGTEPESSLEPGDTQSTDMKAQFQRKINEASGKLDADTGSEKAPVPAAVEADTPSITFLQGGMDSKNLKSSAYTYSSYATASSLTINEAGTYVLSGGTSDNPIKNLTITVGKNISDDVNMIWDNLCIDNSSLGTDSPVFAVDKSTASVNITLKGNSVLKGNNSYIDAPAPAVVYAGDSSSTLRFTAYKGEEDAASLTIVDSMPAGTDFGSNDPGDGIFSKGKLVMAGGIYDIRVNGDCLKGTGTDGKGGIVIIGGKYTLRSNLSNALKSKDGNIVIAGGEIKTVYTKEDGINAKNYSVVIKGGSIDIDKCYGDGIQGENVNISGDKTVISIKTYFENAGINYYDSALGSGNYNTMAETGTTTTETVSVDTGSHKGIKGGTKACTYSYSSVGQKSEYTAGTVYTEEASGGIIISGGKITIDTGNTGIKYNGGMKNGGSGNLSAADKDGKYIIGSPDDAVHSNNTCVIAGGVLDISSADDGITAAEIMLINGCDVTISQCYEGIEAGEIIMGASKGSKEEPSIKVYSNDDGINASSKTSVNYVYADESEEQYTKTSVSSKGNIFSVLSGYLNVMIADEKTHSFSLAAENGNITTGTYTADGDGIDCNGSFYAYGGTIIVYGSVSNDNSPVDTDDAYYIDSGATLLAVGSSGMAELPTKACQPVISYPSSGGTNQPAPGKGGPGGGMPGGTPGSISGGMQDGTPGSISGGIPGKMPGGASGSMPGDMPGGASDSMPGGMSVNPSFSADSSFAVLDGSSNVLLSIKPIKAYSYILYSSPELTAGSTYTLYNGGEVSGTQLNTDSKACDYRYTGYNASGASTVGTVIAK